MNENNAEVGQSPDTDPYAELRQYIGSVAKEFKRFDDLTDTEKIERLRRELQSANSTMKALVVQLHSLLSHRHGDNGELLVPLHAGPFGYPFGCVTSGSGQSAARGPLD